MKQCPRCKRSTLHEEDVMNSLSHIGKDVYICNDCGKYHGLVRMNVCEDIVEIEMERRFNKEILG